MALQALSLKETEKAVLSERVCSLQAELSTSNLELERLTRETQHLKEQERVSKLKINMHTHLHTIYSKNYRCVNNGWGLRWCLCAFVCLCLGAGHSRSCEH